MIPLISVLVPSYNHERYVEMAVRSVLDQDWPRIELLVSDDGSSDGTWDVLQRLRPECERRLERVGMERHDNRGSSWTLGLLRKAARGDYIAILASDDAFLPGALTRLAAPMSEDEGVGVTVGLNELMDSDGCRCYWNEEQDVVHDPSAARYAFFNDFIREDSGVDECGPEFGSYSRLLQMNHVPNGALIRKTALDRIPDFTPEAPLEDWWLHLQLSKVVRYKAIREATFRYRWHATNTVKQRKRMRAYWLQTLGWEERFVMGQSDSRWREIFVRQCWDVRRKFRIRSSLDLRRIRTVRECRYVMTFLGHEFVLFCRRRRSGRDGK